MRKFLPVLFFSISIISCKNKPGEVHQLTEVSAIPEGAPSWKIIGTEPFWNIYIHADTVLYTRLNENIDSLYFEDYDFSDQDSLVKFHLLDPFNRETRLIIRKVVPPCSDGMSDNQYEYSAEFSYGTENLKGCATKITSGN